MKYSLFPLLVALTLFMGCSGQNNSGSANPSQVQGAPPPAAGSGNGKTQTTPPPQTPSGSDKEYSEIGFGGEGQNSPLHFKFVTHDFGALKQGQKTTVTFPYKNVGKASIEISQAVVACNCITTQYKQGPIHPGETGEITVTFDSQGMPVSSYEKLVSIVVKDVNIGQALQLKGKVY